MLNSQNLNDYTVRKIILLSTIDNTTKHMLLSR